MLANCDIFCLGSTFMLANCDISVWVQRSCLRIVIFLFGFNVRSCKVTYFWVTCFRTVILLSGFMSAKYYTSVGLMLSECDTGIIRRLGYQINEFTRLPLFCGLVICWFAFWRLPDQCIHTPSPLTCTAYFLVRILVPARSMYSHPSFVQPRRLDTL